MPILNLHLGPNLIFGISGQSLCQKLKREYCLWWLREFLITRGYLNYQKNSKERDSAFKNRTTPKEAETRQMSWESRKLGSDLDRNRVMSDDSDSTCQRHATELPDKGQVYKRVRASARAFGLRESLIAFRS